MKKMILLFLTLIVQVSFSQTKPDFKVSSTGYFCHQDPEDAYTAALTRLQISADNICKNSRAILVTNIVEQVNYCSIKLNAGYICENNRVTCRPRNYHLKCCDRLTNSCWIE